MTGNGESESMEVRMVRVEKDVAELRRDLDHTESAREAGAERLTRIEMGLAMDVAEIKASILTINADHASLAKDWREAYGEKRELSGRWYVAQGVGAVILVLFGALIGQALWHGDAPPPVMRAMRMRPPPDASVAIECTPQSGWPCESSPSR